MPSAALLVFSSHSARNNYLNGWETDKWFQNSTGNDKSVGYTSRQTFQVALKEGHGEGARTPPLACADSLV